ncbi:MAG: Type secretion cytoplasmic protein [Paucimonas sp.]|nr:Type secretion cytoplasmic protein [Paucimonas sp.]
MVFIVRAESGLSCPEPQDKVIKGSDFWAFCEAREAVDQAVRRHDAIIDRAKAAYLAEQRRGYEEGNERARLEQSRKMMELVNNTVEYFARVEGEMVELVMSAMRQIVNGYDDRERVLEAVRSCLALVRSQKQLRLRVHPTQLGMVKSRLAELMSKYPGMSHVDVTSDRLLALDACAVESEIGTVEASMTAQVEVLRETLAKVFDGSPRLGAETLPGPRNQRALTADLEKRRTMV